MGRALFVISNVMHVMAFNTHSFKLSVLLRISIFRLCNLNAENRTHNNIKFLHILKLNECKFVGGSEIFLT